MPRSHFILLAVISVTHWIVLSAPAAALLSSNRMNIFRRNSADTGDHSSSDSSPVRGAERVDALSTSSDGSYSPDHDQDAVTYNAMASAAVELSEAVVSNGVLSVIRSIRDIDNNKRRKFLYSVPVPQESGFFPFSIPPTELNDGIKARVPSRSGDKIAVLREEGKETNDGEKKQILEIWTNDCQSLSKRIMLPSSQHGKVVNDPGWFGQMAWNEDETALVYSAERRTPAVTSFFATDDKDSTKVRGRQNMLGWGKTESWGEKYSKMSGLLDLFVVNIATGRVGRVKNVPGEADEETTEGGFTLGQACFSPCGTHIVYTGWDAGGGSEMPRRLGMIYCMQRPSKIYASPVTQLLKALSKNDNEEEGESDGELISLVQSARLSRSPRFSPAQPGLPRTRLVFLSSKFGFDTHNGGVALNVMNWNIEKCMPELDSRDTWVETVLEPASRDLTDVMVSNMGFPGLYCNQLPVGCCSKDYMLVTTQWGSVQKIVRISLADGKLTLFNVDIVRSNGEASDSFASQTVLCSTLDGGFIVSESAPNQPAILGYVSAAAVARDTVYRKVEAALVAEMAPITSTYFADIPQTGLSTSLDFTYDVLTMRPPQIEDQVDTPVQWIVMLPKGAQENEEKPPLIVVPHGGPHSCTSTTFAPSYAFLCASGYAILHVNYRGSTGFGQGSLEALPGHVGLLDVKDVVHAAVTLADTGWIDRGRIGICGGSHGGFLTGHCIGQFPELFKVAAMRNPVTNIATMVTATDIPDWCYVETLGCGYYSWKEFRGVRKEELEAMYDCSPIRWAEKVVAPTLVALGMSDKRVPPSQGLEFYHVLRSQGVKTKLLMYDGDDHAIDKVESEADHWINIKQWFDEHLKTIETSP